MIDEKNAPPVTDFVWKEDDYFADTDLAFGERDPGDMAALALHASKLRGQFGLHQRTATGSHALVRDALGVNKLFFAIGEAGEVDSSNFLIDLVRRGHPLDSVWSVPSGHAIYIEPRSERLELARFSALTFGEKEKDPEERKGRGHQAMIRAHADRVRDELAKTFERLRDAIAGRPLYVTMSGGLDSTVIATLAREHFGPFVGLSFELGDAGPSQDVEFAGRVAEQLGVEFVKVQPSGEELVSFLDDVLIYGQDWRDFNVHCGLVNWAIARAIAARHAGEAGPRPIVLTGDVMNELMADYSPVDFEGEQYYRLPRMSPGRLRRFLVAGLDTGDREVGIYSVHGVDILQPYAICADAYTRLPDALVGAERSKQDFVREMMGDRVPSYIYERPKVRAQVGSAEEVGGTMALLLRHGHHSQRLASRFADLFGAEPESLGNLIRGGLYRFTGTYPGSE